MRAVIIGGGRVTDYELLKGQIKENDTIICADSGYDHAVKMGLSVSAVVGDFDSIKSIPQDVTAIKYPSKKDMTDTELAIEYARGKGFNDFLLIAMTGSRLDHTLANILLLKGFLGRNEHAVILDEHNKIMLTDSVLHLCEPTGSIVSLLPLSDCHGVSTENFEYPLHNASLLRGTTLGISNIMTTQHAAVSLNEGLLLVVVARD